MKYYYFHGYGSSPEAEKSKAMQEILGSSNVIAPNFNVSKEQIPALFTKIVEDIKGSKEEVCIVGSSLGGLYALYISSITSCHTILLNPALLPIVIVPKVTEEVPVEAVIKAQEFSLYSYKHYKKENVSIWVTDDPLINHKDLTKPFFYKGYKEYREFDSSMASGHEFIGFKNVFEKYINNQL